MYYYKIMDENGKLKCIYETSSNDDFGTRISKEEYDELLKNIKKPIESHATRIRVEPEPTYTLDEAADIIAEEVKNEF